MNRMSVERRPVVRKVRGVSPYQYALGLDLGQVRDHSAIVVVEQVTSCFDLEAEGYIRLQAPEYRVRHVERFPLGTTYPAIVDGVEETLADPALTGKTWLVVDGTGVGVPVVNMFQQRGRPLLPIVITGGDSISYNGQDRPCA